MLVRHLLFVMLSFSLLAGCASLGTEKVVGEHVPAQQSSTEIPEDHLLDVWIELFDAGQLPEDAEKASGLSMDIRNAEARYMPEHLRGTMEKTGYWGAVRVVPQGTEGSEVLVRGTILVSDGENLELNITALDASGRQWFDTNYRAEIMVERYRSVKVSQQDVFQSLYNQIANDLARYRDSLSAGDIVAIRRIAALRFAADLSPEAYKDHLRQGEDGGFTVLRLPAANDPMYQRIKAIRERDFLLIDTLNGHFDNFYREMQDPYLEWRKARSEESAALRKIKQDATKNKLIGAAAILGAIAIEVLGSDSTRNSTGSLRDFMVLGGAYAIKKGIDKDSETTIHRDAIKELGDSFSEETRPLVVDVEGETHQLTGSAEVQYAKWRSLLKRIYASETGLTEITN